MVATPGTIPALTQYQPGALPLTGTEAFEIVNTTNASTAASYYLLLTDAVGKAPGVLPLANPTANDVFAFTQNITGLPKATTLGSFGIPFGNVAAGGTAGQLYFKNSGTNFDASWTTAIPSLTLGTVSISGIATTGGLAVNTVATVAGLVVTTGTATNLSATNGTVTNLTVLGGTANLTLATVANLAVAIGTATSLGITNSTVTNLTVLSGTANLILATVASLAATNLTFASGTATSLRVTNFTVANATVTASATIGGNLAVVGSASLGVPLTVPNGGLATNVLGTFSVLIGGANNTASVRAVAATTAGMVLTSNGSTSAPSWFGSMVLLNTLLPSAIASVSDTTSFTSTYRDYMIQLENVCPATNTTNLQIAIATTGAAFVTNGYVSLVQTNVSSVVTTDATTSIVQLTGSRATTAVATTTTAGVSGTMWLRNPTSITQLKQFSGQFSYQSTASTSLATASLALANSYGVFSSTTAPLTGVQFLFSSGNIATGTIKIWGLV